MWHPSEDDSVDLFARHFEALHRSGALRKAADQASTLRIAGDDRGHRLWKKVADRVRHLRHPSRVAARRQAEMS
jgi:hypothetical protein